MAARKSADQDPAATGAAGPADGSAPKGGTQATSSADAGTTAQGPQTQTEGQTDAAPADGAPTPTPVHLMPVAPVPPPYDPSLNETVPGGRYLVDDVLVNAEGEPLDDGEDDEEDEGSGSADGTSSPEGDEGSPSAEDGAAPPTAPQPTPEARPPSHRAPGG